MDELERDEIEVRAIRLDRLGLDLSDAAKSYICNLPVFDELCDAIQNAVIECGVRKYIAGMKHARVDLQATIEQPRQVVEAV